MARPNRDRSLEASAPEGKYKNILLGTLDNLAQLDAKPDEKITFLNICDAAKRKLWGVFTTLEKRSDENANVYDYSVDVLSTVGKALVSICRTQGRKKQLKEEHYCDEAETWAKIFQDKLKEVLDW